MYWSANNYLLVIFLIQYYFNKEKAKKYGYLCMNLQKKFKKRKMPLKIIV